MENYKIIDIRENPQYMEMAIDFFASKWGIDRRIYFDCISNSIKTKSPLPRWFLLQDEEKIIGGCGLIVNDFISRQDLWPWLCALYINKDYRGKNLGNILIEYSKKQAKSLGFQSLHLATGHLGYYEKFGFEYIGEGYHPWDESSRIYKCDVSTI